MNTPQNHNSIRKLVLLALFAAIMCVLSPFTLPTGIVPISLATFALYLTSAIIGKWSAASVAVYIALGAVGLPVFSGAAGGIEKLVGPTGGYIIGYLPCAFIAGLIIDKFEDKKWAYPLGMALGTVVLYALGTAWFIYVMGQKGTPYTLGAALMACVVPFLIGDAIKIIASTLIGISVRKALGKQGLK